MELPSDLVYRRSQRPLLDHHCLRPEGQQRLGGPVQVGGGRGLHGLGFVDKQQVDRRQQVLHCQRPGLFQRRQRELRVDDGFHPALPGLLEDVDDLAMPHLAVVQVAAVQQHVRLQQVVDLLWAVALWPGSVRGHPVNHRPLPAAEQQQVSGDPGQRLRRPADPARVHPFLLQRIDQEITQKVGGHAAAQLHPQAQAGQVRGQVADRSRRGHLHVRQTSPVRQGGQVIRSLAGHDQVDV